MAEQSEGSSNFVKAFLPGLVVGTIVGLAIGVFIAPFLMDRSPAMKSAPGTTRQTPASERDPHPVATPTDKPAEKPVAPAPIAPATTPPPAGTTPPSTTPATPPAGKP